MGSVISPPHVMGRYSVRFLVNDELKLETSFTLNMANPAELAGIGVLPPPGTIN